jgi:tRNA (guanine37-N1)-methyltransferase
MRFDVITLFPDLFRAFLTTGIFGRAIESRIVEVMLHDLRAHGDGTYRKVDDAPYGGGGGMVLLAGPLTRCLDAARAAASGPAKVILMSPQGRPLNQATCRRLAGEARLLLVCGRYEGIDERFVEARVDEEVSIGDYILSGGELPAMVMMEAMARLLPGALGDETAADRDSFSGPLLDHPHYTRPEVFEGREVPSVLLSGDHAAIERWRTEQALEGTRRKRPDLLEGGGLHAAPAPAETADGSTGRTRDDAMAKRADRPDAAQRGRS